MNVPKNQFIILLADQRSGTNALRDSLISTGVFGTVGEAFFSRNFENEKFNFHRHFYDSVVARPELITKLPRFVDELFSSYLEKMSASTRKTHIIVDIKYTSVHQLNPVFHDFVNGKPYLFNLIEKLELPVIHLMRRDYLAKAASRIIARETGLHIQREDHGGHGTKQFELDPSAVVNQIKNAAKRLEYFERTINKLPTPTFNVDYEGLFDTEESLNTGLKELKDYLSLDVNLSLPKIKKQISRSLEDTIANYEEVMEAVTKAKL